jgi:hypothetical protein
MDPVDRIGGLVSIGYKKRNVGQRVGEINIYISLLSICDFLLPLIEEELTVSHGCAAAGVIIPMPVHKVACYLGDSEGETIRLAFTLIFLAAILRVKVLPLLGKVDKRGTFVSNAIDAGMLQQMD